MIIREATREEEKDLELDGRNEGVEKLVLVIDEDGVVTGHLCLSESLKQLFGHDTRVWSKDTTAAARLWLRARQVARIKGFERVVVHFESEDDPMKEFWQKLGFTKQFEVWGGEI